MQQSTHQEIPVITLIEITKELTSIMNEEMECLKTQRPSEIKKYQKRKGLTQITTLVSL